MSEVCSFFQEEELSKGDFLLRANKRCHGLSFIRRGYVRVYATTEKKEVTQWIASSPYFITDLSSFLYGVPAQWNLQAITDCQLFTIRRNDYDRMSKQIPEWHELEKRFITDCFRTMELRIFQFLSSTADERFQALMQHNSELFNHVPLVYLASMLGMTPETLSRLRRNSIS